MSEIQPLVSSRPPTFLVRCIKNSVVMEQHLATIKPSPHASLPTHGSCCLCCCWPVSISVRLFIPSLSSILSAHLRRRASPQTLYTQRLFYPPSLFGCSRLLLCVMCCIMMHFSRCVWGLSLVLVLHSGWTRAQQSNNTR